MGKVKIIFDIFMSNPMWFATLAVIMVSALIVFIGLFVKPIVKKLIKNNVVKDLILSFGSIVLSFGAVAGSFWVYDWNFTYFLWVGSAFAVCTVFVYWLYEHTYLKAGIHKLGTFVLKKLTGINVNNLGDLKSALKKTQAEIQPVVNKSVNEGFSSIASYVTKTVDDEFKNL